MTAAAGQPDTASSDNPLKVFLIFLRLGLGEAGVGDLLAGGLG
jgi:hypothetical protein